MPGAPRGRALHSTYTGCRCIGHHWWEDIYLIQLKLLRMASASKADKKWGSGLFVDLSNCKYEIVRDVCSSLGIQPAPENAGTKWDLCWSDLSVSQTRVQKMRGYQRINHFPGMLEICRKCTLARHLKKIATQCPKQYTFFPRTWTMPEDWEELRERLRRKKRAAAEGAEGGGGQGANDRASTEPTVYIVKPSAGAMGRGIYLAQAEEHFRKDDVTSPTIIQQYVPDPLLIDGRKFDLRIYALVTSVNPLRIFIHEEGLARFAVVPYESPGGDNLETVCMHLTNYAINKHCEDFVMDDDISDKGAAHSSKRSLASLWRTLAERGADVAGIKAGISDIVVKTVLLIQPHLAHMYCSSVAADLLESPSLCFELLGFDILIDSSYKLWLMEVNHSPSFTCDGTLDIMVKTRVIRDAVESLGLSLDERKREVELERKKQQERLYTQQPTHQLSMLARNLRHKSLAMHFSMHEFEAISAPRIAPSTKAVRPSIEGDKEGGRPVGKCHTATALGGFVLAYPHETNKRLYQVLSTTALANFEAHGCSCSFCGNLKDTFIFRSVSTSFLEEHQLGSTTTTATSACTTSSQALRRNSTSATSAEEAGSRSGTPPRPRRERTASPHGGSRGTPVATTGSPKCGDKEKEEPAAVGHASGVSPSAAAAAGNSSLYGMNAAERVGGKPRNLAGGHHGQPGPVSAHSRRRNTWGPSAFDRLDASLEARISDRVRQGAEGETPRRRSQSLCAAGVREDGTAGSTVNSSGGDTGATDGAYCTDGMSARLPRKAEKTRLGSAGPKHEYLKAKQAGQNSKLNSQLVAHASKAAAAQDLWLPQVSARKGTRGADGGALSTPQASGDAAQAPATLTGRLSTQVRSPPQDDAKGRLPQGASGTDGELNTGGRRRSVVETKDASESPILSPVVRSRSHSPAGPLLQTAAPLAKIGANGHAESPLTAQQELLLKHINSMGNHSVLSSTLGANGGDKFDLATLMGGLRSRRPSLADSLIASTAAQVNSAPASLDSFQRRL
eukprot:jgi/Mesvir1/17888/Mv12960-RA.1